MRDHGSMGLDDDTRWLTTEEMRAWRALLGAQHRLGRVLDLELQAAHGTTLADHEVLIILSEQPGGALRMADLADMLTISRSGLTRRVDRMAAIGLVSRERCTSDGRGVFARITPAGMRALELATPVHVAGVRRHFVDVLSAAELDLLAAALEKVAADAPGPNLVAARPTAEAIG
jgi:DNA-binding MarR family transcriptional regulator